jgi:WD40 repeat protein
VCLVAPDPSESGRIWVGRTDGSVLAVQLGDEFLTSFRSQLAATFDEGTGSAQVTSRLVNNNDQAPGSGRASDEDDEDESKGSFSGTGTPFELEFQGSVGSAPVSCLLVDREQLLFSSCRGSSDVQQWKIVDASDDTTRLEPLALLRGAHGPDSNIVMLKTTPLAIDANDPAKRNVLVSVAQDGSLGLWDLDSGGEMLGHFQIRAEDPTEQGSHLLSADSDGTRVFVGTSRGQVLAFAVHDLIANARGSASSPCPVPNGLWVASVDHPITAIACSGPGTLGTTQDGGTLPANASVGLITGDGSGTVRQWEIVTRTTQVASDDAGSRPATKLEHWPRLSTQRLPKRAHVFQRMHEGPVTALLSVDSTKLLSASGDGSVVAWNPVSGKSYFFLDGFESDLRSLCVQENTLVTDGMKHLVCVHDFNIDELEPDDNDDSLSDRFDVW